VLVWDQHTDPHDKVVTEEIVDLLWSREVVQFISKGHIDNPQLDVETNFAVAQEFDVALRTPSKKEQVWSIDWRIDNVTIATRNERNE
jgi:hypothetical protein